MTPEGDKIPCTQSVAMSFPRCKVVIINFTTYIGQLGFTTQTELVSGQKPDSDQDYFTSKSYILPSGLLILLV